MNTLKTPLFEQRALTTLRRAEDVFKERGVQYGDTWAHCQFLTLRAVARHLGCAIPEDAYRALATAALVDMKYQRMEGGYKQDHLEDGINYQAFLAAEVEEVLLARMEVAPSPSLATALRATWDFQNTMHEHAKNGKI